ncbi:TlpA family protein disulfide reductase [Actinoplanes sp. CA-030573]|uniref:TlpA family protein disulfide reductase n=1 Tax=Actinoplanes sp. CA-030573 TaxID=3239898 RepID=UPI003D90A1E6
MDPLGIAVIVAVLIVATTFGLWRRRTDGVLRDEAAEKRKRAAILRAAGLEVVEIPDHSSPTAAATAAAKAASTAAAAAVQGAQQTPKARALTVVPAPAADPEADVALDRGEAAAPEAGVALDRGDAAVSEAGVALDRGEAAAPVPDREEEPGVVEDAAGAGAAESDPSAAGRVLGADLRERLGVEPAAVTLLQFSSAFCAPCRAVRRVSSEVAELLPGVRHVEVDAESHLDEVRELGIWRTPTLLVLDAEGRVVKRATGVPSKPQLIAALAGLLPARG